MRLVFVLVCLLIVKVSVAQDCKNIPKSFTSYQNAINTVKSSDFSIVEHCDTSKSSWVRGASFYSCNDSSGYLLLATNSKTYIHKAVPKYLWDEFKQAESFGKFYNAKLKGRYQL